MPVANDYRIALYTAEDQVGISTYRSLAEMAELITKDDRASQNQAREVLIGLPTRNFLLEEHLLPRNGAADHPHHLVIHESRRSHRTIGKGEFSYSVLVDRFKATCRLCDGTDVWATATLVDPTIPISHETVKRDLAVDEETFETRIAALREAGTFKAAALQLEIDPRSLRAWALSHFERILADWPEFRYDDFLSKTSNPKPKRKRKFQKGERQVHAPQLTTFEIMRRIMALRATNSITGAAEHLDMSEKGFRGWVVANDALIREHWPDFDHESLGSGREGLPEDEVTRRVAAMRSTGNPMIAAEELGMRPQQLRRWVRENQERIRRYWPDFTYEPGRQRIGPPPEARAPRAEQVKPKRTPARRRSAQGTRVSPGELQRRVGVLQQAGSYQSAAPVLSMTERGLKKWAMANVELLRRYWPEYRHEDLLTGQGVKTDREAA